MLPRSAHQKTAPTTVIIDLVRQAFKTPVHNARGVVYQSNLRRNSRSNNTTSLLIPVALVECISGCKSVTTFYIVGTYPRRSRRCQQACRPPRGEICMSVKRSIPWQDSSIIPWFILRPWRNARHVKADDCWPTFVIDPGYPQCYRELNHSVGTLFWRTAGWYAIKKLNWVVKIFVAVPSVKLWCTVERLR